MTRVHRTASPVAFFLLVFAFSVPFWVFGSITGLEIAPRLPISSLMAVCPAIAASILTYRTDGAAGVGRLLKRVVDGTRIAQKRWYAPALLLVPVVMILSCAVMRWLGRPVPTPDFSIVDAVMLFVLFFLAGAGEELGWSGYVIDPLQTRWNALGASILVGVLWAVWHLVPLLQAQRAPAWIAGWCLGTVALRILTVWLYNNTKKSVFATILFHDMSNVSWLLFPSHGSHYDPRITGPILALTAAIVVVIWGPRTLARHKQIGAASPA